MYEVNVPWDHPRAPQLKASSCRTPRLRLLRRKSSPVARRMCAPAADPHSPAIPTPPSPSVPPILEAFVIDLGPALRVCRPAGGIEECLDSMEKRN